MLWALVLSALVLASGLIAQPLGKIQVQVKDPSGAAVAASLHLVRTGTGLSRTAKADAQGVAAFSALDDGRYRLDVTGRGFESQSLTLEIRDGATVARTVTLSLGATRFQVEVVGATPLAGSELPLDQLPFPVQTTAGGATPNDGSAAFTSFLTRRLSGLEVNEFQGNPMQPDVSYRGYTASPLLGTPQGLSVFWDGVRMNEPFGDVVNWDLIPRAAIAETTLMPGSNPLFGLNTLGGALSLESKDGNSYPGTVLELSGGSFGRKLAQLEHGGARGAFNWFGATTLFFDDGWRVSSPTDVRQFFGRAGWQRSRTSIYLSGAWANNHLTGNGLQEQRFLARDYTSVFTKPDVTGVHSPLLNLTTRHSPTASVTVTGNVHWRQVRSRTLNSDLNEISLDESVYQPNSADIAALRAAGYSGFPLSGANASNTPFPYWRCIAQALQKDEPAEKCNGLLTRGTLNQHTFGAAGQATWTSGPRHAQFSAGASVERSGAAFSQNQQFAYLNPDRSLTPVNAFADGSTNINGDPYDTRVQLDGRSLGASVYGTGVIPLGHRITVLLGARFDHSRIDNRDRLQAAGPGSLTAGYSFNRANPSIGAVFAPSPAASFYASYSAGSRAPTSVELGCADPNLPCKLPNAMAGDPPLRQVVTRTFEAGVRGRSENVFNWSAGFFRATNRDDILFVASTQTGYGYFKNFGETLRQGLELTARASVARLTIGGGYTLLDATYRTAETLTGASNSANSGEQITIQPGAHIPLLARHLVNLYGDVRVLSKLTFDLALNGASRTYARGNENNLHQPDGKYYIGPGFSPGYAVVQAGARYELISRVQLFVQANNLFDRRYYTAAQLASTGFTDAGAFVARPFGNVGGAYPVVHATFYAPGTPRTLMMGLRVRF